MKEIKNFKTKPSLKWQLTTILKLNGTLLVTHMEDIRNSTISATRKYGKSLNNFINIHSMNKALSTLTALAVVFTLAAVPVAASSDGVGPGHPLYGVDLFMEDIQLNLADDPEEEADLLEGQMEERTGEIEDILDGEVTEEDLEDLSEGQQLYEDSLEAFGDTIDELCGREVADDTSEESGDVETTEVDGEEQECDLDEKTLEKVTHVGEMTLKHLEVLAGVYDAQVERGNDNAADSILGAMESSMNGHKSAVAAVSKTKKDGGDDTGSVEDFELPDGDIEAQGSDKDEDDTKGRKKELKDKVKEQKEKAAAKVEAAKARRGGRK